MYLAKWKAPSPPPESQLEEMSERWEKQMEKDLETFEQLSFIRQSFFGGLFTVVLPESLLEGKKEQPQGLLFYSHQEKAALSLRLTDHTQIPESEKIKADYIGKMKASKQQTKIEEDGRIEAPIGLIYYFLASHAMPGEKQYDYAVLFAAGEQTVIMDFSFRESGMILWKAMLDELVMTIQ